MFPHMVGQRKWGPVTPGVKVYRSRIVRDVDKWMDPPIWAFYLKSIIYICRYFQMFPLLIITFKR